VTKKANFFYKAWLHSRMPDMSYHSHYDQRGV